MSRPYQVLGPLSLVRDPILLRFVWLRSILVILGYGRGVLRLCRRDLRSGFLRAGLGYLEEA